MFDGEQLQSLLAGDFCILKWSLESGWPVLEQSGGANLLPDNTRSLELLINPMDLPGVRQSLNRAIEKGTVHFRRGPYRIASKEGERWVSETSLLLPPEEKAVLSVLRDVSSDREMEETLEEARRRFELAVDATGDGLWDWDLTSDRVFYSTRWKNMLGYEESEIGNSLDEWRKRLPAEDLERATEALERHLAGHTRYYVNEHRMRRKDGSFIWILDRGMASRDENGRPVRMVGFHTDITKHRELEDSLRAFGQQLEARVAESTLELRRQLNKFQLIFNASNDAFLIHYLKSPEHSDDFIEVNDRACELFGYSRKQFEKMYFSMLFPPEGEHALKETYETILNAGKVTYQGQMLASKGQLISVELSSHLFRLAEGWACFSSVRDIRERLRLEKENEVKEQMLIQQSRMASMGEMIGAIAHQWKQPLNAISMAAGMILESKSQEELAETEEIILQQVDFLSQTINDFREFFRPNRNESVFLACESAQKLMRILAPVLQRESIQVEIPEHQHFEAYGQANEFLQVLLNLVTNARDAFLERGIQEKRILISHSIENGMGVIRIQDNAGGIPDALLPDKLFQPNVSTKGEKGTGIGLSLSRTIVEGHMNGSLCARNHGEGAEFTIRLPLAEGSKSQDLSPVVPPRV